MGVRWGRQAAVALQRGAVLGQCGEIRVRFLPFLLFGLIFQWHVCCLLWEHTGALAHGSRFEKWILLFPLRGIK